jgi:glucose-6-phosphate isomerase
MPRPADSLPWQTLQQLATRTGNGAAAPAGGALTRCHADAAGITVDWHRQGLSTAAFDTLEALFAAAQVGEKAQQLVAGAWINPTESRPVLHPRLRLAGTNASAAGETDAAISASLEALTRLVEGVRSGRRGFRSAADRAYTDVLVVGIGGSALGPALGVTALQTASSHNTDSDNLRVHFVGNIDGAALDDVTATLPALTTLVVVVSKTFTTEETVANALAARAWLREHAGEESWPQQFVAVTANASEAVRQGYLAENTLTFHVGVGGRFSLWSSVGLPIALAHGVAAFRALLDGAATMDQHFASAPFRQNLPQLLAAFGIWNRNFRHIGTHAVLPYAERLGLLPRYLQQLEMESNGKSVDLDGNLVSYATAPVVFGEAGTNGQHSFHQLLHQGTDRVASDVLIVRERMGRSLSHHQSLLSNAFAQADALWLGNVDTAPPSHRLHQGGRPVSMIELTRLDAFHLGALLAMYEHKVFSQGVIWHINSFDQWGVELGKTIARGLMPAIAATDTRKSLVEQLTPPASSSNTAKRA